MPEPRPLPPASPSAAPPRAAPAGAGSAASRAKAPDVASVLAAAPLPLVLTTLDARVLFANRAMQRLIGVPTGEISGRFLAEYAGPPHGRLRRLAAVAGSAGHPITTEVSFSLGRRRSIAVRVVVSRGTSAAGESFLVWQVTSSPTAHALPEPPGGDGPAGASAGAPAGPSAAAPATGDADDAGAAAFRPQAELADGEALDDVMAADAHVLTLEMIRTAPDRPVEEVADRVAALAGQAFAGRPLRVWLDGGVQTPVAAATDPVATLAAQTDAELGGGPVAAARTGTVVVADLAAEERFGRVPGELHRRLGLRSLLAAPLRRGPAQVGTLLVLADVPDAFGDAEVWLADWLAAVSAGVIDASVRYNSAATETRQLRTAMSSRAVIEQAKGILMARDRVDEDTAFSLLRVESQTSNRRLRDVAVSVVEEASGVRVATPGDDAG